MLMYAGHMSWVASIVITINYRMSQLFRDNFSDFMQGEHPQMWCGVAAAYVHMKKWGIVS